MKPQVLIVDDSLTVRMDLAEAFESSGFDPILCATAAAAREAFAQHQVDAVILDVLLPDGDGVTLLQEIRDSEANGPAVIMLSTEAEVKDRIRGLQTGADEYVGKPYETSVVVAKVQAFLRARQSPLDQRRRVLLIDDSATFRNELADALDSAGYLALTAVSGEDGLLKAADQHPDAIVVDGMLPGIDGATVIRKLRLDAALRSTPCLLLTAADDKSSELLALDAGADVFVSKDEGVAVILAKLAAVIRAAPTPKPATGAVSLLSPKKILAVDDSETYLHELADALQGEGYDVILAHSGEEALELLSVQSVDCILLDVVMPGLGGKETCRRIKSADLVRDVPLIMLTALEDRSTMIEGLREGADDYIAKSGDFEVLKARLRAQIRRKQFEDENRSIREQLLRKEMETVETGAAYALAETRAALVDELDRKNRELETLSRLVSHDLRVPLRTIDHSSQVLLSDYSEKLDAEAKSHLERLCAAARRMVELIDDLLRP